MVYTKAMRQASIEEVKVSVGENLLNSSAFDFQRNFQGFQNDTDSKIKSVNNDFADLLNALKNGRDDLIRQDE